MAAIAACVKTTNESDLVWECTQVITKCEPNKVVFSLDTRPSRDSEVKKLISWPRKEPTKFLLNKSQAFP